MVLRGLSLSAPVLCNPLRRPQRQGNERQGPVRTTRGRQGGGSGNEQVLVIVRLAIAVAHARRWIATHAAAARGMVEVAAHAGAEYLAVMRTARYSAPAWAAPSPIPRAAAAWVAIH